MGLVIRQTIKSSMGMIAGAGLGALLILAQTRLMSQQEYGFSRSLSGYAVSFAILFAFGIQNTLSVFLHRYEGNTEKKSSLLFLSVMAPSLLLAIMVIPFYFFRHQIAGSFQNPGDGLLFLKYYWTFPVYTFAFMLVLILEQTLLAYHKTSVNTLLKEVLLRVANILLVLGFAIGWLSYTSFIWGWTFAVLGLLITVIFVARRFGFLPFKFYRNAFTTQEYRELFRFSIYHWLLNFSLILLGYLDVMMIAPLDKNGLQSVAIYSNAIFLVSLMAIAFRPLWLTAYPALARAHEQNDDGLLRSLFYRSSINIQVVAVATWGVLVCNLHNATSLFGPGYEEVAVLTLILSLGRLVDMITGMNDAMLSITKHYKYFFYFTAGIFISLVALYYWAIPRYGIYGAAWSTTVMIAIYNVIKWWLLKVKLQMDPFRPQTWRILLIGLCAFAPAYYLPQMGNVWVDVIVRSLLLLIIFGLGLVWLKPSADIENIFQNIRNKKRLF